MHVENLKKLAKFLREFDELCKQHGQYDTEDAGNVRIINGPLGDFLRQHGVTDQEIPRLRFDMEVYDRTNYNSEQLNYCGTAGCAVGFAPYAGIPKNQGEDWDRYSKRCLVAPYEELRTWTWCFDGQWAEIDNTPLGAALRIEWMLEHGVPSDCHDQMTGEAPLCYREQPVTAEAPAE